MRPTLRRLPDAVRRILRGCAALVRRGICRLYGGVPGVLRLLTSYRAGMSVLVALILIELCVLGIGVTRKLDNAYERAAEAARTELAVLEAQALADELPNKGSAGIGAAQETPQPDTSGNTASDTAPPLRPRDVATIVAQETGTPLPEEDALNTPAPENDADASPTQTTVHSEGEEDSEEADRLIRRGVAALIAGDMRLSITSFEQAVALAPNNPALLYYYGLAYDKLLNPTKAREYYTKVFRMRDAAGKYFARASRRLTYGMEQPSAMRGKLSFGPYQNRHTYDTEQGENVDILLPVLLAPGEEVRPDDIYITIQFFDLVNGRRIEFSRTSPKLSWQNEKPTWVDGEENLLITYAVPALSQEEIDAYGNLRYYGFTAKLYYKGEPLDCISMPSALILHEQRLNSRRQNRAPSSNLLPDDGLSPDEEAVPFSDFLEEIESESP